MSKDITSVNDFTSSFESVVLSTIDKDGLPYSSYATFVKRKNTYYLLVSENAEHSINVKHNNKISLFFIEDESKTTNMFFRKRLSYKATAKVVAINKELEEAFLKKFGDFVRQLFKMDFKTIKVKLKTGKYIIGPAKAFNVNEKEEILKQSVIAGGHKRNN